MVKLDLTQEFEVFFMMFDRSLPIFTMISIKHHKEYFNFWCKIQLDHPVLRLVEPASGVLEPVPPPPPPTPVEPCPLMFLGGRKSGFSCVLRAFFLRMGTPSVAPISQ